MTVRVEANCWISCLPASPSLTVLCSTNTTQTIVHVQRESGQTPSKSRGALGFVLTHAKLLLDREGEMHLQLSDWEQALGQAGDLPAHS